jgi:dihydroorotate dehydrogenase
MIQIGTMNYQNPNLGTQIKEELVTYYSQNGIENTEDLIGKVEYHSN